MAAFLVTCEHGGNRVPAPYRDLFQGFAPLLRTHRGYDRGALTMARQLARALDAPLVASTTTRLLADLNRSPGHRKLHFDPIRAASMETRREILDRCYFPYRNEVESRVRAGIEGSGRVIHLSSHSFTPELNGEVRDADIGLLYDPARPGETALCRRWQAALESSPRLRVRRNYPYRGSADGLVTHLRRRFPPENYVGVELEINQKHVAADGSEWRALRGQVVDALLEALSAESAFPTAASADPA